MASYKSVNRSKRSSTLVKAIEPIQAGTDRYGELKLMIEKLFCYSVNRIRNFPRDQKWPAGIGCKIMDKIDEAMAVINAIIIYNPSYDREAGLRQLCVLMRTMNSYIKVAYQRRYITSQNWQAWVKQTVEIDNLAIRMAMYMQKSRQAKRKKKATKS